MNSQSELEHLKNYRPSIDDLKMRPPYGSFTEFIVDEGDNWLVELYGDKTDELQSFTGVTHWMKIIPVR